MEFPVCTTAHRCREYQPTRPEGPSPEISTTVPEPLSDSEIPVRCGNVGAVNACDCRRATVSHQKLEVALKNLEHPLARTLSFNPLTVGLSPPSWHARQCWRSFGRIRRYDSLFRPVVLSTVNRSPRSWSGPRWSLFVLPTFAFGTHPLNSDAAEKK